MAKNLNNEEEKKLDNTNESNKESSKSNEMIKLENNNDERKENNTISNEEVNNNTNKEENCNCCGDGCKCGDCNKCSDNSSCNSCSSCNVNGNKKCCAKKLIVILSLTACILSIMSLNKVNKFCVTKPEENIEALIKTEVKDVISKNPQLVLDAISNGLVNKRDNMMKQSAVNVESNKSDIIKSSIRIGDANAKLSVICFFDPTGAPCKEAQKIISGIVKANKNVCFYLVPVPILGDQSEQVAKVYYQLQELDKAKSSNKLVGFLQEITKEGATLDKVLDIIKVNKHELNKYSDIAKIKIRNNTELLEKLKNIFIACSIC